MSSSSDWLIDGLMQRVPSMRIIYEEHVADNGEVLPHVLFWDFTRHIVESYISGKEPADWIPALDFLEGAFGVVDDYSRGVISASFLESLPYAGEPGAGIAGHLGPTLRSRLAELRRSANLLRVPSAYGSFSILQEMYVSVRNTASGLEGYAKLSLKK